VQVELLEQLLCPYCGAGFRVRDAVEGDEKRIRYGLVECRCFAFPVVDGILLLSLAKGYGGAEEAMQPYVPMQVAAIGYLEARDVAGLRGWMRRHAPFAADLIEGSDEPYLRLSARAGRRLAADVEHYLADVGAYEVIGTPRPRSRTVAALRAAVRRRRERREPEDGLPSADDYYAARFFSPRVNALALQFAALPASERILSLCCGHGVFENLLRARSHTGSVVSVDGQFLNLLVTRRYADHGGNYICHDVQFPLPFRTGAFDGVFSSTCLPEIPAQRSFAAEAIRVTSERGWTNFDSIWNTEMGVQRVDRHRHYRFVQNFFSSLDDYVPMFEECAGSTRRVGVDVPDAPAAYLDGPRWAFGPAIRPVLADRGDHEISIMVLGAGFPGFVEPDRAWLRPSHLAVSYAYTATTDGERISLRRRRDFDALAPVFASRRFPGYQDAATIELSRAEDIDYLTDLFTSGLVTLVPADFTSDAGRLLTSAGTRPGPRARAGRETSG
jgi:SAM-dependent methyltransferase